VNSTLAAHRRRLLLDNPAFDYYPANGDVLVPRVGSGVTLTCTRANATGTSYNSSGQRVTWAANAPRIDHDPDTGECLGILVEEVRSNYFLYGNSPTTHDSGSLSTGTYVLWMEGTGSVAVAAKTATITGAGSATDGSPLTFAVTGAGTVTFTVTGGPTIAQCEKGTFATSYIPTSGSAGTRSSDVFTLTGTNFSSWFNSSQGTLLIEAVAPNFLAAADSGSTARTLFCIDAGASSNFFWCRRLTTNDSVYTSVTTASSDQGGPTYSSMTASENIKFAYAYETNYQIMCWNGSLTSADTSLSLPTVDRLHIGTYYAAAAHFWGGHIKRIRYYDRRIPNDQLQLMTTAW